MGANHTTPSQAYQQGREAALAGRPIYANPHVGVDAEGWRKGYLGVPLPTRGRPPKREER